MKRIAIALFILFTTISSNGQSFYTSNNDYGFSGIFFGDIKPFPFDSLDRERVRVLYDFSFMGYNEISGTWILQVGSCTSRFLPECRYQVDSALRSGKRLLSNYYNEGDPFHFFDSFYTTNNTCRFTTRLAGDDLLYEEDKPSISWQLLDSVADICGHKCKEALGTFRGRTYRVFYAEDIPVSFGPWKLSGLPGLILHAETDDSKFIFHAKQVQLSIGAPILWTNYPYVQVSRKQYMRMLSQMQQHYYTYLRTHLGRSNVISMTPLAGTVEPDLHWIENLETE